jgi:[acyl-carrier-protein] S-malonyltransferase
MTNRLGLLCAGQGSGLDNVVERLRVTDESVGWLKALCDVVDRGRDDLVAELGGKHCAQEILQPALVAVAHSQWDAVRDLLPTPVIVAGYSLGELVAATIGGAMDAETLVDLAHQRGVLMAAATPQPTVMVAVRGPLIATVEDAATVAGCHLAIINGSQETIVVGESARMDTFLHHLAGDAHVTRLDINVPSHTSILDDAAARFAALLNDADVSDLTVPMIRSRDGAVVHSRAEVVDTLAGNVHTTVRWDTTMSVLAEMGCDGLVEVGAGESLTRLWMQREQRPWAHALGEFSSDAAAAAWVRSHLGP